MHIAKHLKVRSSTLRAAVTAYNRAAKALGKPILTFQNVIQYSFLAEFDLLRDARQDIRGKAWAEPRNRILMEKHFKSIRAREELQRLKVESHRLARWIAQEDSVYSAALAGMVSESGVHDDLYHEVALRWEMQQAVNVGLTGQLLHLQNLPGYSGLALLSTSDADAWEDVDEEEEEEALNAVQGALEALDVLDR